MTTNHTLLVCKSCSARVSHDDINEDTVTEGVLLLNQLKALALKNINVQAFGCLWTCNRACSVTFACPSKYTYHFVALNQRTSVAELQQFSELYCKSADGYVKPPEMPGELRSHLLVRVPPIVAS